MKGANIWSKIFIKEGRLRPTWRVVAYIPLLLTMIVLFNLPLMVFSIFLGLPPQSVKLPGLLTYLAAVLAATCLARRFLDRRALRDLGLRRRPGWLVELAAGVGLGALLMVLIFAVELAGGWLEIGGFGWQNAALMTVLSSLGAVFIGHVVVAVNEELISRGYILQNLAEDWGMPVAVAVSSILFGLTHLANPYADILSTVSLVLAGVFLAVGYLVTRSLWLPIALHFSWNFFQGPVFGFPVSGGVPSFRLLQTEVAGPELITGGAFGPEGGLLGLGATVLGIGLLWLWGQRVNRYGEVNRDDAW
ncbi:MAG: lysostaphin resistance A-like protein [Anaerolineae bacterium]